MNNSHTPFRCGHFFNGMSGFPLAAAWAGWENVWHSEIDEFCNKVTEKHFPKSKCYGDIKSTDWTKAEAVDVVTGGFPCQPFANVGERRGTEDERHLWPEMLGAIRSLKQKPRWIVGENVYGIVNWNDGLVFEQVQADLENEGYEVQPYILPAAAVGAQHLRTRTWFVAHTNGNGLEGRKQQETRRWKQPPLGFSTLVDNKNGTDIPKPRFQRKVNGLPNRVDRTRAIGNAIVPQVAYMIFKTINKYEREYGIYE